jgi:type III restriction enzyme
MYPALILDRYALKWFRPAKGQLQIFYRLGVDHREYQPDFVAETNDTIYMLESREKDKMDDPRALAKKAVAVKWCANASEYAASYGGKSWRYILMPHDAVAENMSLEGLVKAFA